MSLMTNRNRRPERIADVIERDLQEMHRVLPPSRIENPVVSAQQTLDKLASQWDTQQADLDNMRDQVNASTLECQRLSEMVDAKDREMAANIALLREQLEHQTARADYFADRATTMHSKFSSIAGMLVDVLQAPPPKFDPNAALPADHPPGRPATMKPDPRDEDEQEDQRQVEDIVNRLPPSSMT